MLKSLLATVLYGIAGLALAQTSDVGSIKGPRPISEVPQQPIVKGRTPDSTNSGGIRQSVTLSDCGEISAHDSSVRRPMETANARSQDKAVKTPGPKHIPGSVRIGCSK
jgi:hypothetical protein